MARGRRHQGISAPVGGGHVCFQAQGKFASTYFIARRVSRSFELSRNRVIALSKSAETRDGRYRSFSARISCKLEWSDESDSRVDSRNDLAKSYGVISILHCLITLIFREFPRSDRRASRIHESTLTRRCNEIASITIACSGHAYLFPAVDPLLQIHSDFFESTINDRTDI